MIPWIRVTCLLKKYPVDIFGRVLVQSTMYIFGELFSCYSAGENEDEARTRKKAREKSYTKGAESERKLKNILPFYTVYAYSTYPDFIYLHEKVLLSGTY